MDIAIDPTADVVRSLHTSSYGQLVPDDAPGRELTEVLDLARRHE